MVLIKEENITLCMVCAMLAGLSFTLQKAAAVKAAVASSKIKQEDNLNSIQEEDDEHNSKEYTTAERPSVHVPSSETMDDYKDDKNNDQNDEDTTKNKERCSTSFFNRKMLHTVEFLFFDIVGNLFFTLILPSLGSVSLYWPTFVAAKLILNAIVFGVILKHEEIPKAVQVGTLIIACAVVYIPIVGPDFDAHQVDGDDGDPIEELLKLENLVGLAWLILLNIVFFIATGIMIFVDLHKISSWAFKESVLFCVFVGASILSGVAARISTYYARADDGHARGMVVTFQIISWLFLLAWTYESYMEAYHVRSIAKFVPLTTFGSCFFNAITGVSHNINNSIHVCTFSSSVIRTALFPFVLKLPVLTFLRCFFLKPDFDMG